MSKACNTCNTQPGVSPGTLRAVALSLPWLAIVAAIVIGLGSQSADEAWWSRMWSPAPTPEVVETPAPVHQTGTASWYGPGFHGRKTANGETYDMHAMTAAHRTLPIASTVRVTSRDTGRSVVVRVNDRGPYHGRRVIDLSFAAAKELGLAHQGTGTVDIVVLNRGPEKTARVSTRPTMRP